MAQSRIELEFPSDLQPSVRSLFEDLVDQLNGTTYQQNSLDRFQLNKYVGVQETNLGFNTYGSWGFLYDPDTDTLQFAYNYNGVLRAVTLP